MKKRKLTFFYFSLKRGVSEKGQISSEIFSRKSNPWEIFIIFFSSKLSFFSLNFIHLALTPLSPSLFYDIIFGVICVRSHEFLRKINLNNFFSHNSGAEEIFFCAVIKLSSSTCTTKSKRWCYSIISAWLRVCAFSCFPFFLTFTFRVSFFLRQLRWAFDMKSAHKDASHTEDAYNHIRMIKTPIWTLFLVTTSKSILNSMAFFPDQRNHPFITYQFSRFNFFPLLGFLFGIDYDFWVWS